MMYSHYHPVAIILPVHHPTRPTLAILLQEYDPPVLSVVLDHHELSSIFLPQE